MRASYLEIYNEEIRDLLGKDPKNKLDLKENIDSGVYVKGERSFFFEIFLKFFRVFTFYLISI